MEKSKRTKKRIVPFLNYTVSDFYDYDELAELDETKKLIFNNLRDAITQSIQQKKATADIFMINSEEYIVLNKDKWKETLERAIEFYAKEGVEDYESCTFCKELINKL